jgi:hypothetical protein
MVTKMKKFLMYSASATTFVFCISVGFSSINRSDEQLLKNASSAIGACNKLKANCSFSECNNSVNVLVSAITNLKMEIDQRGKCGKLAENCDNECGCSGNNLQLRLDNALLKFDELAINGEIGSLINEKLEEEDSIKFFKQHTELNQKLNELFSKEQNVVLD